MRVEEENPLASIGTAMAFSPHDWGSHHRLAWIWGIVKGWDSAAMEELSADHKWDRETVARLIRLHERFKILQDVSVD